MLYVPIKIYPNERSVRACVVLAGIFLGLASVSFFTLKTSDTRLAATLLSLVGFSIAAICAVATMRRQPMIKVLDDRFSVYTPFGYALIRFGEVLSFKKGGLPGMRTLRIDINKSARPKFRSGVGRLLYSILWLNFANVVAIQGYLLGSELDSVIKMLEKRRLAAVRLEAIEDYDPTSLVSAN